ncbi:signal peptide peptidase SppA [Kaistia dalseonensis]|uniref:Protease-4 n=2 Tax=Kaistia dalseonensis TaxID=410840 RepID=A0ABU0H5D9_9HYPH|nr:signal peptide peptidase SppA [Kaistia dalseonensis]MCX5494942.1 signal peptide peptidase SppA [Kaistia dalseonensis]MDQ0437523.1 protease-4 [Kaistia dalseonensis]
MDAEDIIDRRRLRRKLSFWRVLGLIAIVAAVAGGIVIAIGPDKIGERSRPHIARLSINGFIAQDQAELDLIQSIADSDAVRGVIVSIDSGGGATVGGESLYDAIRKLAAKKPTVASIKTVGASAAYMTAIATDHVVAYRSSITGSIGVLFQSPEISEAMAKLGIKLTEIKSSPLKAAPSPFAPASPEATAVIEGLIRDSYDWFVDIVAERRKLDRPTAVRLADGRIYSGRQALAAGLVDEIGGEDQAVAWLAKAKSVNASLPIVDWKKEEPSRAFSFAHAAVTWLAVQAGLPPEFVRASGISDLIPARLNLDGLMSVWQAPVPLNDAGGLQR